MLRSVASFIVRCQATINSIPSQFLKSNPENRRRHRRDRRITLLTILALDNDLSKTGKPMWGISSDFSQGGIGFTCSQPIDTNYVRVTVDEDKYSVIGVVRHCRLYDEDRGTYFVGIQFLDDYNATNGG